MIDLSAPSDLPKRTLKVFVAVSVTVALVAFCFSLFSGWVPSQKSGVVGLPLWFALLLAALTASFVVSGNTLMHHFRTGTVQRVHNPVAFWVIVAVQTFLVLILLFVSYHNWTSWYAGAA